MSPPGNVAPVHSSISVALTSDGLTSGMASGSVCVKMTAFLIATRARAWIRGTMLPAKGISHGRLRSVALTSVQSPLMSFVCWKHGPPPSE